MTRTLLLPKTGPDGRFAVPPVEDVAAQFTDWEVRRLLGHGGMGAVYEAWQPALERTVALKILPPELLGSGDFFDRFQHEARAMARLDHPNVAQVFETGITESGEPYIVMELVGGEPITSYARRRELGTQKRLDLFRQVCAGVQHAHQKGIVHRDLKPSNVLVTEMDGVATPKVIDFGLAKPVAEPIGAPAEAAKGEAVGTPVYMSPEQAAGGDVDTRADIFSLGALLCELLTGNPPTWRQEPDTSITTGFLRSLSPATLGALEALGRDLDAILRRALAPEARDRYPTVGALMEDLDCQRMHRPVSAVEPGPGYLVGKFLRRHHVGVGVTAGVLGLLLVGVAMLIHESVLTHRAEVLAEARLQQGEKLIEFMLGDLHAKLSELGRLDVLENAIVATEKFHADTSTTNLSPGSLRNRAHSHLSLGRLRNAQGRSEATKAHYDEAIRLYRAALAVEPANAVWQEELAQTWNSLAVLHHVAREVTPAESAYQEALQINARMRAAEPQNPNWADSRASILHNLAALYESSGRLDEAERSYAEVQELWTALLAREPDNPGFLEHLSTLHQSLAFLHARRSEEAKAAAANAEALRLRERLVRLDPNNLPWLEQLANIQQNISEVHHMHGRLAEAEEWLDRYQPIRERLARFDPSNAIWQQYLADAHRNRALLLTSKGDDPGAAREHRVWWEIAGKLYDKPNASPTGKKAWLEGLKTAEEVYARLLQRAKSKGLASEAEELERTVAEIRTKLAPLVEKAQ